MVSLVSRELGAQPDRCLRSWVFIYFTVRSHNSLRTWINFPAMEIHLETKHNCWLPCRLFILHHLGWVICVGILKICGHTPLKTFGALFLSGRFSCCSQMEQHRYNCGTYVVSTANLTNRLRSEKFLSSRKQVLLVQYPLRMLCANSKTLIGTLNPGYVPNIFA